MELIVISHPEKIEGEALVINNLLASGVQLFHLRKPTYSKKNLIDLILEIQPQHRSKLVLHDYHSLAGKIGTHRIHFSEARRLYTTDHELKQWRAKKFILSTSIHKMEDYSTLSANFDYTFYGPVFESISKQGYAPPPGNIPPLPELHNRPVKIIAVGGISSDKIPLVRKAQYDGAAMLGAIWQDPARAIETYKSISRA